MILRERRLAEDGRRRRPPRRLATSQRLQEVWSSEEECSASPASDEAPEEAAEASSLDELIAVLSTDEGRATFVRAFRANMAYKVERYAELQERAEELVAREQEVIAVKRPRLKEAAGLDAKDKSDDWSIFDSISQNYREARDRASQFEAIRERAQERLCGDADAAALVEALQRLTIFSCQHHILRRVVDLVASFLKDPRLFRRRMMNFIFMGGAGTGKSMISAAIGDVFAKAGMFVGSRLIEAGRAELVGQYEGQTVARTRDFLMANLDCGVIFIDEAYAITPWQDGKPEGYGSEATTAMVEFMTRFQGLYCIITAGYEREMTRYFLPTNEGLSRRFPYKFVLRDMPPPALVRVFQRQMLEMQGLPAPVGEGALASEDYFSAEAYRYLSRLLSLATDGTVEHVSEEDAATRRRYDRVRRFHPRWPRLYEVFEHQAGAMELLAYEAITVLMATVTFDEVAGGGARTGFRRQPTCVMRQVIEHRIEGMALSEADSYLDELARVEQALRM